MQLVLTPELILEAYRQGVFPMAYNGGSPYVHWICPEMRGLLPIADFHIPRRLKSSIRNGPYEIKINTDFDSVIRGCAERRLGRPETWINQSILNVFCRLHQLGHAHSVECWADDGTLAGGVYGLAIGGAFFGESMFSRARDASKIALVHLAARLYSGGFTLFDTQFVNDHLKQFGVFELPHDAYKKKLDESLLHKGNFLLPGIGEAEILTAYPPMRSHSP